MKTKKNILNILIALISILILILIIYSISQNNKNYGLKPITNEEIKEKQQQEEDFILIITSKDCAHCASYKPKINKIAKNNQIIVYYLDLETIKKSERKTFLKELKLSGTTPITMFFKKGKETSILNRITGDLDSKIALEHFKEMGFIA